MPVDNDIIKELFGRTDDFKAALNSSTVKEINGLLLDLRKTVQEISPFAPEARETLYKSQPFASYIQTFRRNYWDSFEVGVSLSGKEIEFVDGEFGQLNFLGEVESPSKLIKDLQDAKSQVVDLALKTLTASQHQQRGELIADLEKLMGPDTKFENRTIADKVTMVVLKSKGFNEAKQRSIPGITPAKLEDRIAQIQALVLDRGKQQQVAKYLFASKTDFRAAIERVKEPANTQSEEDPYFNPLPAKGTGLGP